MRDPIVEARDVTTEWLTEALAHAGIGDGARIVDMATRSIGTGQVGENVRFTLTWSEPNPSLPTSVVGKFPSESDVSRNTAALTGSYVNEVGFYRDLAGRVAMRTPVIHYVAGDPVANAFVVIMEDITPAAQGDQLTGCTVDQAALAVDEAAALHASTWGMADELAGHDWMSVPTPDKIAGRLALYDAVLPGFIARYEPVMTPDEIDLGRQMAGRLARLWELQGERDSIDHRWCLVHGDYRLDNLLFGSGPGAPPVTVVDWQTVSIGSGPSDVAYLLGSGLLPPEREANERALVERYVAGLAARGVDVSIDAIWERYVLGSFSGYSMAVIASQIVEQTERGDAMFVAMAQRHAAQVRHLGLLDRLN